MQYSGSKNQLGRRNLDIIQRTYLYHKKYEAVKKEHGDFTRVNSPSPQNADLEVKRASEVVAEQFHVNHATIERAHATGKCIDSLESSIPGSKNAILGRDVKSCL